eukprot:3549448-Amphidinium_carterae.1
MNTLLTLPVVSKPVGKEAAAFTARPVSAVWLGPRFSAVLAKVAVQAEKKAPKASSSCCRLLVKR